MSTTPKTKTVWTVSVFIGHEGWALDAVCSTKEAAEKLVANEMMEHQTDELDKVTFDEMLAMVRAGEFETDYEIEEWGVCE